MDTASPTRRTLTVLVLVALVVGLLALPASAQDEPDPDAGTGDPGGTVAPAPAEFTSRFRVRATADQVIDPAGGQAGGIVTFDLRLDSTTNTICFRIDSVGVTGPFLSPASTATHIHQGVAGAVGPPVVLFPNPLVQGDGTNRSEGCRQGNVVDDGFSLADIESDPSGFYVDVHTVDHPAGAVRAQLGQPISADGAPGVRPTTAVGTASVADDGEAAAAAADEESMDAAEEQIDDRDESAGEADDEGSAPVPAGGVAAGFGGLAGDRTVPVLIAALLVGGLATVHGRILVASSGSARRLR